MKKIILFVFAFLVFSINKYNLAADCEDIMNEAKEVDKIMLNINNSEVTKIQTMITNLTNNLYVVVLNDYDNNSITYHYSDVVDGVLNIDTFTINKNINYVVKIYSEDKTCGDSSLKTINYTTPKYNEYSTYIKCQETETEIELCSAFYDVKDMTYEEFVKKVDNEIEKIENESHFLMKYIKKYYLFVLIPIILIVAIYFIRIIILKRGSKNA